jgi:hypothetical protein
MSANPPALTEVPWRWQRGSTVVRKTLQSRCSKVRVPRGQAASRSRQLLRCDIDRTAQSGMNTSHGKLALIRLPEPIKNCVQASPSSSFGCGSLSSQPLGVVVGMRAQSNAPAAVL